MLWTARLIQMMQKGVLSIKVDLIMLERYLRPYLIGYVNEHYEDVDDQLVFAYDEAHATRIVLETFKDAKFVFQSRPVLEQVSAA